MAQLKPLRLLSEADEIVHNKDVIEARLALAKIRKRGRSDMFSFLKRLKDIKAEKLRLFKEKNKRAFISYVNAYKDHNSTMQTMYLLIHGLEVNIKMLVEKNNLVIDFDFLEADDYYEIQIYSSIETDNEFYIAIGTQAGINTLLLQDNSEINADQFTTNELIEKIIEQIETYHLKDK